MNARPFTVAVLVNVRSTTFSMLFTGEVRTGSSTTALASGTQLIGSGWPVTTPLPTTGLRAGSTPATADRLHIWDGDSSPRLNSYTIYYLDNSTTPPSWQLQDAAQTATQPPAPVQQPFHGIFLIHEAPLMLQQVAPW
jgi:hypothetical protein